MGIFIVSGILPFEAPAIDVVLAGVVVPWFVPLLWVAGVATTLGYALGVMAVPRIGSRLASFVGLSEVLFALGFAWIFLSEVPAPDPVRGRRADPRRVSCWCAWTPSRGAGAARGAG